MTDDLCHCGRLLTQAETVGGDWSTCPRTPPCPQQGGMQPQDAWPAVDDDDDDDTAPAEPVRPREGVMA